jgi:hypothetical protein
MVLPTAKSGFIYPEEIGDSHTQRISFAGDGVAMMSQFPTKPCSFANRGHFIRSTTSARSEGLLYFNNSNDTYNEQLHFENLRGLYDERNLL